VDLHSSPRTLYRRLRLGKISIYIFYIRGFCEIINSGIHPFHNIRMFDFVEPLAPGFDRIAFVTQFLQKGFTGRYIYIHIYSSGENSRKVTWKVLLW
jgi:hypothetical protein